MGIITIAPKLCYTSSVIHNWIEVVDLLVAVLPRYCYLLEVMDGYPRATDSRRRGAAGSRATGKRPRQMEPQINVCVVMADGLCVSR